MKSIVTKHESICAICGRPAECKHHLISGSGRRQLADKDSLIIPLCNRHHNMGNSTERLHDNPVAEALSKMVGQLAWEKRYIARRAEVPFDDLEEEAREEFMARYGESYL